MPSYNKVILMGNLTVDPVVTFTPQGTARCNFSLAINESYTRNGQRVDATVFVECTAWEKKAEFIGEYFKKGQPIHVEGKLRLEKWQDKQTGQNRQKLSVTVFDATFCESKKTGDSREQDGHHDSPPASDFQQPAASYVPEDDAPF